MTDYPTALERFRTFYEEMGERPDRVEAHAELAIGFLLGAQMPGCAAAVMRLWDRAEPELAAGLRARLLGENR